MVVTIGLCKEYLLGRPLGFFFVELLKGVNDIGLSLTLELKYKQVIHTKKERLVKLSQDPITQTRRVKKSFLELSETLDNDNNVGVNRNIISGKFFV